ncbi:MAG: AMP-binding protein [Pseudomonadota bacterium]
MGSMRSVWKDLDRFNKSAPDHARLELSRRLSAQMRYFGGRGDSLPEWREAARMKDPSDLWRAWTDLPIMTKEDIKNRFNPGEMVRRFNLMGTASATGGSTGEPTSFFHDYSMKRAVRAASVYCWIQFGWRPGIPVVVIWGSERDVGKQRSLRGRVIYRLADLHLVDGYALGSSTVDRVLDLVVKHRPVVMYGFTGMLEFLAREVLSGKRGVAAGDVLSAWNGGEMLVESQSRMFRRAFGVDIRNYYGGRELGPMAFDSEESPCLRVLRPFLFLEIVDDFGKPVAPGQIGRLVWTSTVCRGTPFLRYDIGDMGTWEPEDADESGIRRIRRLHGRKGDVFLLPHGKTISGLFWNHLFKDYPQVNRFQVVLTRERGIKLLLQGQGFSAEQEAGLKRVLAGTVGAVPVAVSWMESIPLSPQGKLVQVINEWEA